MAIGFEKVLDSKTKVSYTIKIFNSAIPLGYRVWNGEKLIHSQNCSSVELVLAVGLEQVLASKTKISYVVRTVKENSLLGTGFDLILLWKYKLHT